ncbi:general substrate transporter [Aaosphaeria arxii CBS 175.79]|uniref:General substrate transporter n=1 Tax=Aaosphaeria arxii CBS 175.79 TaxID=1450172 RepID=A0A6A5XE62_9PLEO|nr:general substrate transporter [Aaosphaeria arxii CBS 175.79]KAF2011332.1 general substrate transporter [Aaosphaeria arxii CBS 175.79]
MGRYWFKDGAPLRGGIASVCLAAFLFFGYDQGVLGGILQMEDFKNQFNHPNDTETGAIVSAYCLGALGGCILNFYTGDRLGRRKSMWLAMSFVFVGATLQASAFTVAHLVVGRVITGLGTGIDSSTVPTYQSELCRAEKRGRKVSWEVMFIGVGIVLSYWMDFGFSYLSGSIAWRFPIAFQLVFAIIVTALIFGLPESPRWLFKRGRRAEAIEVLCAVFDLPESDPYIQGEIRAIENALDTESNVKSNRALFKKDRLQTRRRVMLAYFALLMNQLVGPNLIVYYIPTILTQNVGLDARTAQIVGGCVQIMFVIGCFAPALALDRMGRRPTMLWGCLGLGICMVCAAGLLQPGHTTTSSAAIAFFFLWMLIFGGTINVVPWVYGPEILPLEARARGVSISVAAHWMWNFFVVMISPILVNRLRWGTYLLFGGLSFVFVGVVWKWYPETSNYTLEEIDSIFLKDEGVEGARRRRMSATSAAHAHGYEGGEKDGAAFSSTDEEGKGEKVHVERRSS